MDARQLEAVRRVGMAIAETVAEVGEAPEGVVYAALMSVCSLAQFQALVNGLCTAGYIVRAGNHVLKAGPKAASLVKAVR